MEIKVGKQQVEHNVEKNFAEAKISASASHVPSWVYSKTAQTVNETSEVNEVNKFKDRKRL